MLSTTACDMLFGHNRRLKRNIVLEAKLSSLPIEEIYVFVIFFSGCILLAFYKTAEGNVSLILKKKKKLDLSKGNSIIPLIFL